MKTEIDKMIKEVYDKKKAFVSIPKKSCEVIIKNFQKPLGRLTFEKTEYIVYDCVFLKINGVKIPEGKHNIQLPFKSAWFQLYHFLKEKKLLKKKNVHLFIVKKNNYHYLFTLSTDHYTSHTLQDTQ